ncbi:energy transducer TonB family protein [Derxia gummosa]|uniref:Energy transducer TonB family protein n=1 Tax=Derxia gummosa DSM 723 TaxID=1121388 RepID=A0A8B6XAF8_9BURK|nr:energy transducer TonB [Derxia gummosa]
MSLIQRAARALTVATPVLLLAACASQPKNEPPTDKPAPETISAAELGQPVPVPAPAPAVIVAEPAKADLDAYKRVVAERIAATSRLAMKQDAPRPADTALKGVTVVGLQVHEDGKIDRAWVVRSSGDDKLDQAAVASVTSIQPLPLPPENTTLGLGYTIFSESWLHRADGRFQLISKTLTAGSGPALAATTAKPATQTAQAKPVTKTASTGAASTRASASR